MNGKKSKITLVVSILVVAGILVAAGGYLVTANSKKWWPFAESAGSSKTTEVPLAIKKVMVKEVKGRQLLDISLALNTKDKGHCVLTLKSRYAGLSIDDSKAKRQTSNSSPLKQCPGWSIDVSNLTNGSYTIDVKFVGAKGEHTASDKVTLSHSKPVPTE